MKKFLLLSIGTFILVAIYVISVPLAIISYGKNKVYPDNISIVQPASIALVLGAGTTYDGKPSPILEDRLIKAAELYKHGKVSKIIVSGDNPTDNYNEPRAMMNYLTQEQSIPAKNVVADFAGRRTYDSCARAREIFGVDSAIVVSQGYHLYRAVFTCNQLGIESLGYSATLREYEGFRAYKIREFFAIHKAILDIYFKKPEYVGGEPIDLESI